MNGSPESVGIMDSSCDSAVFYVYLKVRSWHKQTSIISVQTINGGQVCYVCISRNLFYQKVIGQI